MITLEGPVSPDSDGNDDDDDNDGEYDAGRFRPAAAVIGSSGPAGTMIVPDTGDDLST